MAKKLSAGSTREVNSDKREVTASDVVFNSENKRALDTNVVNSVTGEFSPSGLSIGFTITTFLVGDTASALPSTALTDRNALSVRNLDPSEILYIGGPGVVASDAIGTTSGWQVGPNETLNLDVTEAITIYGIVEAGKSIKVQAFEAA